MVRKNFPGNGAIPVPDPKKLRIRDVGLIRSRTTHPPSLSSPGTSFLVSHWFISGYNTSAGLASILLDTRTFESPDAGAWGTYGIDIA